MARQIARLTALDVKRAKHRGLYNDGGGLHLQIAANGSRSWIFRYGAQGRRHLGLGPLHTITLAEAREKARQCRQQLLEGVDPIAERHARKAAARAEAAKSITFADAAETYINVHRTAWKNPKHRQQWTNTLATYVFPVIGSLPVAVVDTGLVLRVLQPIWAEKPETASRIRARIERVLSWATVQGYRTGDNPARWTNHLDNLLPAHTKIAPVKHHAALPFAEVPAFVSELHGRNGGGAAEALEFLILTAARTGEVIGATWDEFDLRAKLWTVPAKRMKADREHRVPLCVRALEILRNLPRQGKRVFPISNMAMLQLLKRMDRGDITAHGFRSSFRDWAAETHDAERDVVEMALAHAVSDKTEAAYRRGDMLAKRRALMNDWSAFCGGGHG